jgi:hypothetical protein
MWLELTDSLGNRTIVNMDLVVSLKAGVDGNTIFETTAPLNGALHVVVVRETLDEILLLMEGQGAVSRRPARTVANDRGAEPDFVSDGNEG